MATFATNGTARNELGEAFAIHLLFHGTVVDGERASSSSVSGSNAVG